MEPPLVGCICLCPDCFGCTHCSVECDSQQVGTWYIPPHHPVVKSRKISPPRKSSSFCISNRRREMPEKKRDRIGCSSERSRYSIRCCRSEIKRHLGVLVLEVEA